jgi:hypothetical protein
MKASASRWLVMIAVAVLVPGDSIAAQGAGSVRVGGLGSWSYGRTDGNGYLSGSDRGSYENVSFLLTVASSPSDRLRIHGQLHFSQEGKDLESMIDFALAEVNISDAARIRVGRVKHPFGIYTEIFEVGVARPMLTLPQGLYGRSGIVSEGFLGVGLTGFSMLGESWSLEYDVYGGALEAPFEHVGSQPPEGESGERAVTVVRDMIGSRVVFVAPFAGFRFGTSGYTGKAPVESGGSIRHSAWAAHGELLSGGSQLRAEVARLRMASRMESDAWYMELQQDLGDFWQATARYESGETRRIIAMGAESVRSDLSDFAVGLNYRVNAYLVTKASLHWIQGTRFVQQLNPDALEKSTRLFQVGAQFAF